MCIDSCNFAIINYVSSIQAAKSWAMSHSCLFRCAVWYVMCVHVFVYSSKSTRSAKCFVQLCWLQVVDCALEQLRIACLPNKNSLEGPLETFSTLTSSAYTFGSAVWPIVSCFRVIFMMLLTHFRLCFRKHFRHANNKNR